MPKDTGLPRKNFKIYQNKPMGLKEHMRTEPDEGSKSNLSNTQQPKSKISTSKF